MCAIANVQIEGLDQGRLAAIYSASIFILPRPSLRNSLACGLPEPLPLSWIAAK
jgi:hypothetical protein